MDFTKKEIYFYGPWQPAPAMGHKNNYINMKPTVLILLLLGVAGCVFSQDKAYKVGCIGFYNFENLFDTLDAPDIDDAEFLPGSSKAYGTAIYQEKLSHLAEVVSQMGVELTPDGVAILGVAEVENRKVLEDFAAQFLEAFPMERVVEIHVAGLAEFANPSAGAIDGDAQPLPYWIDAHGTPIPDVLFDLLDQVLADPGLTSLKGVALEVDTKPIGMIVEEFRQFRDRFGSTVHQMVHRGHLGPLPGQQRPIQPSAEDMPHLTQEEQGALQQQYRTYVQLVTTPDAPCSDVSLLGGSLDDLHRYRDSYLPHELVHWGGDLPDMFPATCGALSKADVPLERFVPFWFSRPRPEQEDYDFFLLKIDRFVEFATQVCPTTANTVRAEAEELRIAYRAANEPVGSVQVRA